MALEHAAVAAWAAIGEVLRGDGRSYAREIRGRESSHAERVAALVRELGGEPPAGRDPAEYRRDVPAHARDRPRRCAFAADLEEQLVRAYLDALRSLPGEEQRRVAAQIAAEEAADLAVVHTLAGRPAAPQAFVTGTS